MLETKSALIEIRSLQGQWQESVACDVVASWLQLPASRTLRSMVVAAQNDFMAMGARKAFSQLGKQPASQTPAVKYIGCDGLDEHGCRWVQSGSLDATVRCPSLTRIAMDLLAQELRHGVAPQPVTLAPPSSYPPLYRLAL